MLPLLLALSVAIAHPGGQEEGEDGISLALRVNRAIARGVDFLKRRQLESGHWPGQEAPHPGGVTSLCAFTLVKSGIRRSDPALTRAMQALAVNEFESTYSNAVWLLLLDSLGQPEAWRERAQGAVDFLVANQREGVWAYPWGDLDTSNTQFALLGLRAGARLGVAIPGETVEDAASAIWRWQKKDGGFGYKLDTASTGGMTAATLGGLAVLDELSDKKPKAQSLLRKNRRQREAAEAWLAEHFTLERNPYGTQSWTPTWLYGYLWAIERFCGLTGRDRFAGRDWYTEGAELLVLWQKPDGEWGRGIEDTCFALLFLRRATVTSGGELAEIYAEIDRAKARAVKPELRPDASVPRLSDVLLAGPWQGKDDDMLLPEPPFDPKRVRAKEGAKLARREWERVALKTEDWTNLEELTGRHGEHLLWAISAVLVWDPGAEPEAPPLRASLWLDVEDGWGVWLDGEQVSFSRRAQAAIAGDVRVDVELAPGEHRLLVLVEDIIGSSAFGLRITGRGGEPPPPELSAGAAAPQKR